jgi:hypothetical protein
MKELWQMLKLSQTLLGLKPGGLTHPLPVVVTTGKEAAAKAATKGHSNQEAHRADTLFEHILLVILNFMFRQQS